MPVVDRLARAESCVHVYQFGYSCDLLSISMCTMTLYQNLKRCTTRNLFEHAAVVAVLQQISGKGSLHLQQRHVQHVC